MCIGYGLTDSAFWKENRWERKCDTGWKMQGYINVLNNNNNNNPIMTSFRYVSYVPCVACVALDGNPALTWGITGSRKCRLPAAMQYFSSMHAARLPPTDTVSDDVTFSSSSSSSSYPFINVTCQNARTCTTYSDIRELYELKKFKKLIDLCTLCIVNMLVQLNHKTRQSIKVIYNG